METPKSVLAALDKMKMTKNVITRAEALEISADYVAFVEGDFDKFEAIFEAFGKARKGGNAITAWSENGHLVFLRVRFTSIKHDDFRAVDGPVVRVGNDQFSWRVDGDKYAFPYA